LQMTHSCNLEPFLPGRVDLESSVTCEYVRYHIAVLLLFGSSSILMMFTAIALAIICGNTPTEDQTKLIHRCAQWALGFLLLSAGFEFVLLMVYVAFFICMLIAGTRLIILEITRAPRTSRIIVPENPRITTSTDNSCPICLDTTEDHFYTTSCGHTFHAGCILKWKRGTCPVCRQRLT
jgi:hypothetical protein